MSEGLLARLIEEGVSAKLVGDVAMELARGEQAQQALDMLRAGNAERQARLRERRGITPRNVTQRDERYARGAKEIPPDPHKKTTTPPKTPKGVTPQRLPDDFTVPDEWIEWAMTKRGWSRAGAVEEGECFCRYWQAKGGSDASKRSWRKTWENWVVNSRRQASVIPIGGGSYDREFIRRRHA